MLAVINASRLDFKTHFQLLSLTLCILTCICTSFKSSKKKQGHSSCLEPQKPCPFFLSLQEGDLHVGALPAPHQEMQENPESVLGGSCWPDYLKQKCLWDGIVSKHRVTCVTSKKYFCCFPSRQRAPAPSVCLFFWIRCVLVLPRISW